MIVVRDIFQLQFGKAKEAIELLKQGRKALEQAGYPVERILADVTGEYYTLVMETRVESLSEFEKGLQNAPGMTEWQEIYRSFVPLVRSGRREVFREVT